MIAPSFARSCARLVLRAGLLGACLGAPTPLLAQPLAAVREAAPRAAGVDEPRRTGGRRHPRRRARAPRAAPLRYTEPKSESALDDALASMLHARVRSGQWGVIVVSLTRGDTLYEYNPDDELQPASNMKLFTSALALDQFGPDHQFATTVLRDGTLDPDGTLHGNLVIRGDGDPSLSSRFIPGDPGAAMEALAKLVAGSGIKRVTGALVADASAFDTQRIPEGWKSRYLHAGYAARISALSLNENLVWVVVQPGANGRAQVSLDPDTDLPVQSAVRSVAGSGARVIAYNAPDGTIQVRGWIGSRAGERRYELVVEDPTAFAAGAFRRALQAHGIAITGATQYAATPSAAVEIAQLPSPPLARLLSVMNRESINHYAELLFRDAARTSASNGVGSAEAGNRLLETFLTQKVHVAAGSVFAADGSGLSVLDRTTPRALVQLLGYAHQAPWSDAFHASLPVAGESELLRHRMKYTPAQGNLHAKTGTTNTIISLGGYVTAQNGELLAFAFLYNGTDRWNARMTIDAMGATLASFGR